MNAEKFRRIDEIFNHARFMEPEDRTVYLSAACGDEAELKRQLAKLGPGS